MPAEDKYRDQVLKVQRDIVDLEWMMFTGIHGGDGKVFTDQDRLAFATMRTSQFFSWERFVTESYLNDLQTAVASNRNLLLEKYYYMIEQTDPESFIKAQAFMPKLDETSLELVDMIADQYRTWETEIAEKYPTIAKVALPMDNMTEGEDTSFAHYLFCELKTYSKKTLTMLYSSLVAFPDKNRYKASLEYLMRAYGFDSLEEAEKTLAGMQN